MAKLLIVHWGRTAAGPALTLKLVKALLADGRHEVAVSYSGVADIASDFRDLDCPQYEVRTWRGAKDMPGVMFRLPGLIRGLRAFMRQQGTTTTLVPMEHPLQSLAAWAFRSRGSRYVHFMHDASLHPGEQSPVVALLRKAHLRPAQDIVVFSGSVEQGVIKDWKIPADRVHLSQLPPMFDDGGERMARSLDENRATVCGMFGRAVEYKGFDLAVEAVAALRSRGHDIVLRLVGGGVTAFVPEQYKDQPWLQVEDRWLADDEIIGVMEGFDILLLPYKEASQSGVLVEAAALGLPVVTTPVGGLPEQLNALGCGEVAGQLTGEAVAGAIKVLATDPERYRACSESGLRSGSGGQAWARLLADIEPLLQ
ncbi:MAG: glycosyltransferase [Luteococcus sp.]|uniref:glycosyltransferase family 4 protein n=1 Tax=Luteococcus sp. TaxID=1969402 RepID=UPI0026471F40|nr:glycosyltransferase [Luteococcus sp.]MDN5563786.1 glycosyltransferase [Luteococcus sp.]